MPRENDEVQLKALYEQICSSYHKVDDFRAKLLGILPLASGVSIYYGILAPSEEGKKILEFSQEAGWFGMMITIGLLIYELKGIQKCVAFIHSGANIEGELLKNTNEEGKIIGNLIGKFQLLSQQRSWINWLASEPFASAIVYSSVLMAWSYVAYQEYWVWKIGLVCFIAVIIFWGFFTNPKITKLKGKKLD